MATREDGTISFIEIFSIIIKWRKVFLIGILIAVCLAVAGFFFFPNRDYQKSLKQKKADIHIRFRVSVQFDNIVDLNEANTYIIQYLNDAVNIFGAYRAAGLKDSIQNTDIDGANDDEQLNYIRKRFILNTDNAGVKLKEKDRIYSAENNNGTIEIIFSNSDIIKGKDFLRFLRSGVESSLKEFVKPLVIARIETYEALILIKNPVESSSMAIVNLAGTYYAAKKYLKGEIPLLVTIQEPYEIIPYPVMKTFTIGYMKKALIGLLMLCAVLVIVSFIGEYVRHIRNDQEAMIIIHNALGKK
jgi:hypothetical protein